MFQQVLSVGIGIDPIAFSIGHVEVRWESIMYIVSFSFILLWLWHFGKARIKSDAVMGIGVAAIIVGLIVARLFHVIDFWDYYTSHPGDIIGLSGLAIFGGILGGALGAWMYCRFRGIQFAPLVDIAAPGAALAEAIGRIGCTINGDSSGEPTSLPWGFIYSHPDSQAPVLGVPIHPTQVYQLLWNLIIFAILFWGLRGRLKPDGSLFIAYLALYSIGSFVIRLFRSGTPFVGPLHEGQFISLVILAITIPLLIARTRWVKKPVEKAVVA